MLKLYMAGAIRDGVLDDIQWREDVATALGSYVVNGFLRIYSPVGGNVYDPVTKVWTISGVKSTGPFILHQDFWWVDKCDILVYNALSFKDKHPNIGSLVEWGRSTSHPCLRLVIWPADFLGHGNEMYKQIHPFIWETAFAVFASVKECTDFLVKHIPVLHGIAPGYDPEGENRDYMYDRLLTNLPTDGKGQA